MLARKKNKEDGPSIANNTYFIGQRVFNYSQINMLIKSLKKLQRLIDLFYKWKIKEELLLFEADRSKSLDKLFRVPGKRKIAIFATYLIEWEFIQWVNVESIWKLIGSLLNQIDRLSAINHVCNCLFLFFFKFQLLWLPN